MFGEVEAGGFMFGSDSIWSSDDSGVVSDMLLLNSLLDQLCADVVSSGPALSLAVSFPSPS